MADPLDKGHFAPYFPLVALKWSQNGPKKSTRVEGVGLGVPPERGRIISGKVSTALGKPWPEKAGDPARPAPSTTAGTAKGAGLKKSSFKIKIEVAIPVTADLDDFARRRK